MGRLTSRGSWAGLVAALALAAGAAPAAGSVTVGQLAPGAITSCAATFDFLQTSSPGNTHVMPAAGMITSWAHRSQLGGGQAPTLNIYRKTGDPATYQVVGHDGPHPIPANSTQSFAASIAVQAGDVLGITGAGGANIGCYFQGQVGQTGSRSGNLADGAFGNFTVSGPDNRLNATAVLDPTNSFTVGKPKRNRKKGTATLTVSVPNPGEISLSGKNVRGSGAVTISKVVPAAGAVKLTIRAKGKTKRRLNRNGKAKVKARITFTPTGGDARLESRKLKLLKN